VSVEYLTPEEAASILKISPKTLRNWRTSQQGPPYLRLSRQRVLYLKAELYAWADRDAAPGPKSFDHSPEVLPKEPKNAASATVLPAAEHALQRIPSAVMKALNPGLIYVIHPIASHDRLYACRTRWRPVAIWRDGAWRRASDHLRPKTWGRVVTADQVEALFPGGSQTPVPISMLERPSQSDREAGPAQATENAAASEEDCRVLAFLEQQRPDLVAAAREWLRVAQAV